MKIALTIITCPGREDMLRRTLESLWKSDFIAPGDFFSEKVNIELDQNTCERRQERQERNSLAALEHALRFEADVILFCEDDLLFNRHLRWNLENWKPLRNYCGQRRSVTPGMPAPSVKTFFFGSLYDPNIRELECHEADNYFLADPAAVYGSQCFVMSRPMVEYFVAHWWEIPGMQDIKMSRLAARLGPIHYHLPSLVQHVGVRSTWTDDNRFHDTKMFDPKFKAKAYEI
jgi:hypothetical protein